MVLFSRGIFLTLILSNFQNSLLFLASLFHSSTNIDARFSRLVVLFNKWCIGVKFIQIDHNYYCHAIFNADL